MECSVGQVLNQCAVIVVKVDVRPSVALRPVKDLLSATDQERSPVLDVSPFPLGNDCLCGVGINAYPAEIQPLEVTALAHEIEPGVVAKPLVLPEIQIVVLDCPSGALQGDLLILERLALDLPCGSAGAVFIHREYVKVALRPRLARHLVFVRFQFRTLVAYRIDDP